MIALSEEPNPPPNPPPVPPSNTLPSTGCLFLLVLGCLFFILPIIDYVFKWWF